MRLIMPQNSCDSGELMTTKLDLWIRIPFNQLTKGDTRGILH